MSLAIDYSKVVEVLIGGEWYGVNEGTFTIDAYEFVEDFRHLNKDNKDFNLLYNGGTGFSFEWNNAGHIMAGPMIAIQAVRYA